MKKVIYCMIFIFGILTASSAYAGVDILKPVLTYNYYGEHVYKEHRSSIDYTEVCSNDDGRELRAGHESLLRGIFGTEGLKSLPCFEINENDILTDRFDSILNEFSQHASFMAMLKIRRDDGDRVDSILIKWQDPVSETIRYQAISAMYSHAKGCRFGIDLIRTIDNITCRRLVKDADTGREFYVMDCTEAYELICDSMYSPVSEVHWCYKHYEKAFGPSAAIHSARSKFKKFLSGKEVDVCGNKDGAKAIMLTKDSLSSKIKEEKEANDLLENIEDEDMLLNRPSSGL